MVSTWASKMWHSLGLVETPMHIVVKAIAIFLPQLKFILNVVDVNFSFREQQHNAF